MHQRAVIADARLGEYAHRLDPARIDELGAERARGHQRDGIEVLLERSERNRPEAIAVVDALTLLGQAEPAAQGSGGQTAHQSYRPTTAAADGAAAAVEDHEPDSGGITGGHHRLLRPAQQPA